MIRLGVTSVTLLRTSIAPEPDEYGNDVTVVEQVEVPGCIVWPGSTRENVQGQQQVTHGYTVVMPPGTDVKATDQVLMNGVTYQVNGTPWPWQSPLTGSTPGVQVDLEAVSG